MRGLLHPLEPWPDPRGLQDCRPFPNPRADFPRGAVRATRPWLRLGPRGQPPATLRGTVAAGGGFGVSVSVVYQRCPCSEQCPASVLSLQANRLLLFWRASHGVLQILLQGKPPGRGPLPPPLPGDTPRAPSPRPLASEASRPSLAFPSRPVWQPGTLWVCACLLLPPTVLEAALPAELRSASEAPLGPPRRQAASLPGGCGGTAQAEPGCCQ